MPGRATLLISAIIHLLLFGLFFVVPISQPIKPLQPVFSVALIELPKKQIPAPAATPPKSTPAPQPVVTKPPAPKPEPPAHKPEPPVHKETVTPPPPKETPPPKPIVPPPVVKKNPVPLPAKPEIQEKPAPEPTNMPKKKEPPVKPIEKKEPPVKPIEKKEPPAKPVEKKVEEKKPVKKPVEKKVEEKKPEEKKSEKKKPVESKPEKKKPVKKEPQEKEAPETPLDFSKAIAKYQKPSPNNALQADKEPQSAEKTEVTETPAEPVVSQFAIARWQRGVTTTVRDNWRKPGGLRGEAALEVIVIVQVGPDGTLLNPKVSQPSGNPVYDESVMRAISKTISVDPPPAGCSECRELEIRFRPEVE